MAQETTVRLANALVTRYIKNYTEKYKTTPTINRYREKWGFVDMIEDLGYDRCKEIIDYYFKTEKQGHPVFFLLQNYDKINGFYNEKQEDERKRAELRKRTAERVREWEATHG